jgi:hypothetical protein
MSIVPKLPFISKGFTSAPTYGVMATPGKLPRPSEIDLDEANLVVANLFPASVLPLPHTSGFKREFFSKEDRPPSEETPKKKAKVSPTKKTLKF